MSNRLIGSILLTFVAGALAGPHAPAQNIPDAMDHQGYIEVSGQPYNGNGAFRFALVDGSGNNVWTNDGSEVGTANMPQTAISLMVEDGIYSVPLGDGTATDAFPTNLFANNTDLALRVWFDDGSSGIQRLEPDKPIRTVPYARAAARAKVATEVDNVPSVITVDRVDYSTARTRHKMFPAAKWRRADSSNALGLDSDRAFTTGGSKLLLPLELPPTATVQRVDITVFDEDDDSDVEFQLERYRPGSQVVQPLGDIDTSLLTGQGTVAIDGLDEDINNAADAYTLVAEDLSSDWDSQSSQPVTSGMYILAVVVEYTVDEAW